jgi:alkyldihydroxyacetonephosphate synthase
MSSPDARARRLDGWGFADVDFTPPAPMLAWLARQLGEPGPAVPRLDPAAVVLPPAAALPDFGSTAVDASDAARLANARGQGLLDLLRLRTATVRAFPDAVLRPADRAALAGVLRAAADAGVRLVPRGGGTSVTGAVNIPVDGTPTAVVDLTAGFSGLRALDSESWLATFGAGTSGPAVEAALAEHGFTLGHFPQSFELSTVGGWVAARASGQESLGYGSIADLLAGVAADAPDGRLDLLPQPASASGPDLRHLVLGSEGRFGIISEATLRVRPKPRELTVTAYLLPTFPAGLVAARSLVQAGVPLNLLRLSDEPETAVALTVGLGGKRLTAAILDGWLRLRRFPRDAAGARGCLLLLGATGAPHEVERTYDRAESVLADHRAVRLGNGPGRKWLHDRFRHPYLRDALLDRGYASETLETGAPWSQVPAVAQRVRAALAGALAGDSERVAVLCHVSHPYRDGASLYFTFFFRVAGASSVDVEATVERWARLKRAACEAILAAGATLTHHHGIGAWHAPWYAAEAGDAGVRLLTAAAWSLDAKQTVNPNVLLDPTDRLRD